jgi:hypothetical protein
MTEKQNKKIAGKGRQRKTLLYLGDNDEETI